MHDVPFETKLNAQDEIRFQEWKKQYAPNDSGQDYDLRGAFKAGLKPAGPEAGKDIGHWPDTFKKPNHPTFSNQSIYSSLTGTRPGMWYGNVYIPYGQGEVFKRPIGFMQALSTPEGSTPSYGFTNSYEPSPQAKAFGKVIDILNDPRNAWIGMGPLAGVVKGPGWGAEALRRYKLIGGTPETLDKTLMRRGVPFRQRQGTVESYHQATDIAAPPAYPTGAYGSPGFPQFHPQEEAMEQAGSLFEKYGHGLRNPRASDAPQMFISKAPAYLARMDKYNSMDSQAAGNAAYGAVSRQVARMLDTPGFYFKRAEDLPPLSDEEYTKVFPLPPSVDVDSVSARIRDAYRHNELNLNQRTERQRDSRGRLPTGRTE